MSVTFLPKYNEVWNNEANNSIKTENSMYINDKRIMTNFGSLNLFDDI